MSVTKEIRALFSEEDKIVGRPATPDLDDLSIPCVGSVKHLIDECREVRRYTIYILSVKGVLCVG